MTWIAAGAAVVGAASQAYSASKAGKGQSSSYSIPDWLESGSKQAVTQAQTIANRAYTPYNKQVVADLSPNEAQASQLASSAVTNNKAAGALDSARSQLGQIEDYTPQNIQKYMSPYTDAVTNAALRKENAAYSGRLSQIGSQASSTGAFGGDRMALEEQGATQAHLNTVADTTATGYQKAFDTALGTIGAQNQTRVAAANAFDQVGGDISKLNSNQISDLVKTGQIGRALQQQQLDFNYKQFLENRDWSVNNLQPLVQTLASVPHGGSGQVINPTGGGIGQILGAGLAAYSMYKGVNPGGGNNNSGGSMGMSQSQIDQINNEGYDAASSYTPDFSDVQMPEFNG